MKKSLKLIFGSAAAVLLMQPAFAAQLFNWEMTCIHRQTHVVGPPASFVELGCPGSGKLSGIVSMPNSYVPGTTFSFNPSTAEMPSITFFDATFPFTLTPSGPTAFGYITLPVLTGPGAWLMTTPPGDTLTTAPNTTFNYDTVSGGATFFAAQGMDLTISPIPEPGTLVMLMGGLAALGAYRQRQIRREESVS